MLPGAGQDCIGIVLAGGRGERMKLGRPKAFATIQGRTLLERAVTTLRGACDEVVVVAPPGMDLPATGAPRVVDVPGAAGPLAGLVAGLRAAHERRGERAIVSGVDFPLLRSAALRAVAAQLGPAMAVIPAPGGVWQPLAAAYLASCHARLEAMMRSGTRSVTEAVRTLAPTLCEDSELRGLDGGLDNFFNVNTLRDLEEAARRLAGAERT